MISKSTQAVQKDDRQTIYPRALHAFRIISTNAFCLTADKLGTITGRSEHRTRSGWRLVKGKTAAVRIVQRSSHHTVTHFKDNLPCQPLDCRKTLSLLNKYRSDTVEIKHSPTTMNKSQNNYARNY